jgi:hypothetical protein
MLEYLIDKSCQWKLLGKALAVLEDPLKLLLRLAQRVLSRFKLPTLLPGSKSPRLALSPLHLPTPVPRNSPAAAA